MALNVVSWNIKDASNPRFHEALSLLFNPISGFEVPDLFIGIELHKPLKNGKRNHYYLSKQLKEFNLVEVDGYTKNYKTWLWYNHETITPDQIEHHEVRSCNRISTFIVKYNTQQFLLTCCHFPDRRNYSVAARALYSSEVASWLNKLEEKLRSNRSRFFDRKVQLAGSILAGDFNMQPFEEGMTLMNCLNAMPVSFDSKKGAARQSTLLGKTNLRFLNPCWEIYSSKKAHDVGFPSERGSYFFRGEQEHALDWYVLDQVIYRPLDDSAFDVGNICFPKLYEHLNDSNEWATDHLPLLFTINNELHVQSEI